MTLAFSAPGLFGKLPTHGDFVRLRAADPAARAFVLWLEEGYEAAHLGGVSAGPAPVRFVHKAAGVPSALVGVLASSSDKVGRKFPLAVFTQAAAADLAAAFPVLPAAARGFLDAASAFLAEAARLTQADLPERLGRMPLPSAESFDRELALARERAERDLGRDLLARLFGDLAQGQHRYGLHCFRTACGPVRGREPARASVVLDCPVREDVDRWTWLELARRELRWPGPPPFAWREVEASRLLLSIGPFPAALYQLLCDAGRRDAKLWPLTTTQPAAIAAADKALGPDLVGALERTDQRLADLLESIAR